MPILLRNRKGCIIMKLRKLFWNVVTGKLQVPAETKEKSTESSSSCNLCVKCRLFANNQCLQTGNGQSIRRLIKYFPTWLSKQQQQKQRLMTWNAQQVLLNQTWEETAVKILQLLALEQLSSTKRHCFPCHCSSRMNYHIDLFF